MEVNVTSKTLSKPIELLSDALDNLEDFFDEITNTQKHKLIVPFSKISQVYGFLIGLTLTLDLKEQLDEKYKV